MKDELFAELLDSVAEAGQIRRGEREPARVTVVDTPDVAAFRAEHNLTRDELAGVLCVNVRTIESWEQKRRSPSGAARMLLQVAVRHPETVLETAKELRSPRAAR